MKVTGKSKIQTSGNRSTAKTVETSTRDIDPYLLNAEFNEHADRLITLIQNYHTNIRGDSHDRDTVLKEATAILESRL